MPERLALLIGPRSHQQQDSAAPLRSDDSLGFTCQARCGRAEGELTFTEDGHLTFIPEKANGFCAQLRSQAKELSVRSQDLIGGILHTESTFTVWWCQGKGTARPRRLLRRSRKFHASPQQAKHCVQLLRQYGSWQGHAGPRSIIVLINPVSGQGRSKLIYEKQVQPILEAAGLRVHVVLTQKPGDAAKFTREADLDAVDTFVVVGGDGTVHELLQGYMQHADWPRAVKVPFMQVPAGSGNALAANCGLWCPVTAAFALCKGQQSPIDITTIAQPGQPRMYSFLSLAFGLISNLDVGTNHLRWMGSLRFTYGGIKESLKCKNYGIEIAYLPAAGSTVHQVDWHTADAVHQKPEHPLTPSLDAMGDLSLVNPCNASELPKGWQSIGMQSVALFVIANLSLIDKEANIAPQQQCASGELHMLWATANSRCQGLKFLAAVDRHGSHMKLPEVHWDRVSAFVLQPAGSGTMLVVDGEHMPYTRICGELHPGLCQVIVA